ncbi:MAG: hypothetical protein Q7S84_01605 [bacterium]|nr:hypothetical protein [bacterium]
MEFIHREFRAYWHTLSRLARSPRITTALGFVVLIAIVWFVLPASRRGGGSALPPRDEPAFEEFSGGGMQRCRVEPFEVVVVRGASVRQRVIRIPSRSDAPYRLLVGDLPRGVTASLHPDAGRGGDTSELDIRALSDAPSGSYSAMLLYRETQEDGTATSAVCQLNLIIP